MSQHSASSGAGAARSGHPAIPITVRSAALPLFAATLFLSAVLLFSVQPLIARMALPMLGGSPAVWNTAMVFFQTVLLAGYAYAHVTSRWLAPRGQAMVHLGVLAVAALTLPVGIAVQWTPPADGAPIAWFAALLAVSVGLPFFAVSATAPILQRWFAHTDHKDARDPYFLYGASNLGSILALLAYPVAIEPLLRLGAQSAVWTLGFTALAVMIGVCAVVVTGRPGPGVAAVVSRGDAVGPATAARTPIRWSTRLHWIALAAMPSSLLLGLTKYITTDIAAIPLLWVVPLTLYLLTFVIVFARRPILKHGWMVALQPYAVILLALFYWSKFPIQVFLPFHLVTFFVVTMVCHGELVKRRPDAAGLTEFYLWMSFGGMVGGALTAIVAPQVFDGVWEYPLALALACLLRPFGKTARAGAAKLDLILPAALAGMVALAAWLLASEADGTGSLSAPAGVALMIFAVTVLYGFRARPVRFALGVAALLFASQPLNEASKIIERDRSFFGVQKVKLDPTGAYRMLINGTTVHGAQRTDDTRRRDPLSYYQPNGPAGQVIFALNARGRLRNVAVVGLGTGTLACYRQPGQAWTFYEIDPVVVRIARDPRFFNFLADCAPDAKVVLGDARLSLARAESGAYDLLVIDAFNSDSIPIHLMTREALTLYLDKLAPGGTLLMHVSNRNLNLAPVLATLAADSGVDAWRQFYDVTPELRRDWFAKPTEWVVIARKSDRPSFLDRDPRWRRLKPSSGSRPWTDDFSDILGAFRW